MKENNKTVLPKEVIEDLIKEYDEGCRSLTTTSKKDGTITIYVNGEKKKTYPPEQETNSKNNKS